MHCALSAAARASTQSNRRAMPSGSQAAEGRRPGAPAPDCDAVNCSSFRAHCRVPPSAPQTQLALAVEFSQICLFSQKKAVHREPQQRAFLGGLHRALTERSSARQGSAFKLLEYSACFSKQTPNKIPHHLRCIASKG